MTAKGRIVLMQRPTVKTDGTIQTTYMTDEPKPTVDGTIQRSLGGLFGISDSATSRDINDSLKTRMAVPTIYLEKPHTTDVWVKESLKHRVEVST